MRTIERKDMQPEGPRCLSHENGVVSDTDRSSLHHGMLSQGATTSGLTLERNSE